MFLNRLKEVRNGYLLPQSGDGLYFYKELKGVVSPEEKRKMFGFINNSDELKVFDNADVIESFNKITSKFEFDYEIGKAEALKTIAKLKSNPAAAKLMVRVCCVIGASDGNFDHNEKQTVRTICRELGIDASEFDL